MHRYTTRILTGRLDRALGPREHRYALAAALVFMVAGAIAATLASRPAAPAPLAPRLSAIIIIATPTPAPPAPTATPQPTAEPVVVVQTVVVPAEPQVVYVEQPAAPAEQPAQAEQAAPAPTDWYSDIPTAPPSFVETCQRPEARGSWICGGQP